jgi:dTDP-4-dehydrorhamnose 3,5-epimerase
MIFTPTPIAGAVEVRPQKITDHRGYFARGWCAAEFQAHGLNPGAAQLNLAYNHRRGTLRGLHYQVAPHGEAKFVRCTRGAIFDVVVDLRPLSATYRQWHGIELSADNGTMLVIPEGCAHGYQTLADDAEMYYLATVPYAAASARGARYNDAAFGITWPLAVTEISAADAAWPDFPVRHPSDATAAKPLA